MSSGASNHSTPVSFASASKRASPSFVSASGDSSFISGPATKNSVRSSYTGGSQQSSMATAASTNIGKGSVPSSAGGSNISRSTAPASFAQGSQQSSFSRARSMPVSLASGSGQSNYLSGSAAASDEFSFRSSRSSPSSAARGSTAKDIVVENPWNWSRSSTPLRMDMIRPTLGGTLMFEESLKSAGSRHTSDGSSKIKLRSSNRTSERSSAAESTPRSSNNSFRALDTERESAGSGLRSSGTSAMDSSFSRPSSLATGQRSTQASNMSSLSSDSQRSSWESSAVDGSFSRPSSLTGGQRSTHASQVSPLTFDDQRASRLSGTGYSEVDRRSTFPDSVISGSIPKQSTRRSISPQTGIDRSSLGDNSSVRDSSLRSGSFRSTQHELGSITESSVASGETHAATMRSTMGSARTTGNSTEYSGSKMSGDLSGTSQRTSTSSAISEIDPRHSTFGTGIVGSGTAVRSAATSGSAVSRNSRLSSPKESEVINETRDTSATSTVDNPWRWSKTSSPVHKSVIRETLGGELVPEYRGDFPPKRTSVSAAEVQPLSEKRMSRQSTVSDRQSRVSMDTVPRGSSATGRQSTQSSGMVDSRQRSLSSEHRVTSETRQSRFSGYADVGMSSLPANSVVSVMNEPVRDKSVIPSRTSTSGAGDAESMRFSGSDSAGSDISSSQEASKLSSESFKDSFRKSHGIAPAGDGVTEPGRLLSSFSPGAPLSAFDQATTMSIFQKADATTSIAPSIEMGDNLTEKSTQRLSTATGEPVEVTTEVRRTTENFIDADGQINYNYEPLEVVRVRKHTKTYSDEQSTEPIEEMELRKTSKKYINPAGSQLFEIQIKKNVRRSKSSNGNASFTALGPTPAKPRSKSVGEEDTEEEPLQRRQSGNANTEGKRGTDGKAATAGKKKSKRKTDTDAKGDKDETPKKGKKGRKSTKPTGKGKGDGMDFDDGDDCTIKPKEREPSFISWLLGRNKKKPKNVVKKKVRDADGQATPRTAQEKVGTSGPSCQLELAEVRREAEAAKQAAERAQAELHKLASARAPGWPTAGPVCRLGQRRTVDEVHMRADDQYDACALPVARLKPDHPTLTRPMTAEEQKCEFRRRREECERAGGMWLPLCGADEPVCDARAQVAEIKDRIMMKLSEIQSVMNETCELRMECQQICEILSEKRCCYEELVGRHAKVNDILSREFAHKDEVQMEMDDCETLLLRLESCHPELECPPSWQRQELDYRDRYLYHMQRLAHEGFESLEGYAQLHDAMLYDKISILKNWHQLAQDYLEETQCLTESQNKAKQAFIAATAKYNRNKTVRDQLSSDLVSLQDQTQREIALATMEDQNERQEDQNRLTKYRDHLQRCLITRDLKYEAVLDAKDTLVTCMKEIIQTLQVSHLSLDASGMDAMKTFDDLLELGKDRRLSHGTSKLLAALPPESDYADHLERIQKVLTDYVDCMKKIEARREELLRQRTELVGDPDPLVLRSSSSDYQCQCPCPEE
ncbi:uncharacterized protein LOC129590078 isoform X2 [Paramacrobiotus metropolitanus]|uniref:uncharacterized protein LOC129590078 isoform X2 n=1 Tax=Paramacrobiotus metropolitanus TaxID=2943436 RepID=UPI0024463630|nr:uncharacterized protein LOC129590078 isoform X2 [Paramacrobiotus metropolitanus]